MEAGRPAMVARYDSMMPSLRRWLIFYHESVKGTAENVKELLGEQGELSELEWHHFPDGFPNLAVQKEDAQRLESFYGTCLIVSFHTPAVIFEQLCLLYALPRLGARNLRVILPWFSTGTMERVEQLGQVATAASLARMLSACPHGPTGPATVVIYDIHALQEQFYFSDTVLVELKSAVWLIRTRLAELQKEHPDEEIAVVFPDDGAQKRFKAKFKEFPQVLCSKVREGDKRIVKIQEGTAEKRHCVILDDLVQSGGTLMEAGAALKQLGAGKVSCFVTHGVFPSSSWKRFVDSGVFHKVWITDSIPTTAAQVAGQEPFEVLSLAPLIANYLKGIADD